MFVELHLDKKIGRQLSSTFFAKQKANEVLSELLEIARAIDRVIPFSFSIYNDIEKKSAFWSRSADVYEIGGRNIVENFEYYFDEDVRKYTSDSEEQKKYINYFHNSKPVEVADNEIENIVKSKNTVFFNFFNKSKKNDVRENKVEEIQSEKAPVEEEVIQDLSKKDRTSLKQKLKSVFNKKYLKALISVSIFFSSVVVVFVIAFAMFTVKSKSKQYDSPEIFTSIQQKKTDNDALVQRVLDKQEKGTTVEVSQKGKATLSVTKDDKGNIKVTYKD